jgi:NitT/TauT family transport system substrate-binding protein
MLKRAKSLFGAFGLVNILLMSACGGAAAPASSSPAGSPAPASAAKPAASAPTSAAASTAASAKPAASGAASAKPAASGAASVKPAASGAASAKPAASTAAGASAAAAAKPASSLGPVFSPSAKPSDKLKLVYGNPVTPPNMVHMAAYIAKDMGIFDEVGLDVEFKSFEGGVDALRGGLSGGLDVVGTSSDPLFAAVQQGANVKAIGTYAPKLSVSAVSAADVKTPKDLKGKKIGTPGGVGAFSEVMARLLLQTNGMTPQDVQYVNVTTAGRVPGLVNKQIDMSILHIDQYYTAIGQARDLVDLANMWEIVPDWWYSAFAATDDNVKNKREALTRFMTAVVKAQRVMYQDPTNTKKWAVEETKAKPDVIDRAYDQLAKGGVWAVNDGMPQKLIDYTVDKEVELGVVKAQNKPTYAQIVDKSLADEAVKRNGGAWTGDPRWY